jgi:ABC-2 type transport system ATP-binding protein
MAYAKACPLPLHCRWINQKDKKSVSDDLVIIRDLSKVFANAPAPSLQNINSDFPRGQIIGIAGPDGAGKTTLMRLIAGLLLPSTGSITVKGCDTATEAEKIHAFLGYMPQKFGLYEDLTVWQNLTLYADLKGVSAKDREEVFKRQLQFTGLSPFTSRFAKDLSGGMKQKLGLACSLLSTPALLLLDEPSVGVDPISRRELWKMVYALMDEGITVVWSTSYLDEAEQCHTVLLLNEGKLLFNGPPQKMTERVQGRVFTIESDENSRRQLLSDIIQHGNIVDATIQGRDIRVVAYHTSIQAEDLVAVGDRGALAFVPTTPHFEDAFLDILGGGSKGLSSLAESTPKIKSAREDVIQAKGLTKTFGSFTAADNITFTVKSGEIFGLLGPNGAGKSTTFKMMCGLLRPTSGQTLVNGLDLQAAAGEARAQIGYMAQKFSLYGNLSVYQNLTFFSGIYNLAGSVQKQRIDQMIDIFRLQPYLNDSADLLPLGFKQRLALSCALMHHPSVLFLDEPTSGVDPITRREFWNHINGLVQKGFTVMVTTHFMDEAEYCDRIGLVYRSKLIKVGTPDALKTLAKTENNPQPTLEDTFIRLIEQYDALDHV